MNANFSQILEHLGEPWTGVVNGNSAVVTKHTVGVLKMQSFDGQVHIETKLKLRGTF